MKKKSKYCVLIMLLFMGLFFAGQVGFAKAQYAPPPYGEVTPSIKIWIDKKIKNPETGDFVDNLGVNDYRFSPGEEVYFKITIKNDGETAFEKVKVKDILPDYVDYVEGSLEVEYLDLAPDESKEFEIKVKVVPADKLPNDQGLYCVINTAEVVADDQKDEDTAQLCIEKKVLGVVVQPEAGVDLWLLGAGFLGISALGIFLKARERKHFKKLKLLFNER